MKNRNWFWGIFLILSAIFVIASQLGSFGQVGVLSVIASILLLALIIQSISRRNFFGIFISLAFLYMIYTEPFGFVYINPWLLIFSAILLSVGFEVLFRKSPKKYSKKISNKNIESQMYGSDGIDDNNPNIKVSFGHSSKRLHSDNLQSGQFIVSFGALEVFFDQAIINPEGAEIFVDCSFGAMELFIPRHWQVVEKINSTLGGVENSSRYARPEPGAPVLTITGNVQLGSIEIHYI